MQRERFHYKDRIVYIQSCCRDTWKQAGLGEFYKNITIVHTGEDQKGFRKVDTTMKIEEDMCRRAKGVWRSFSPEVELCGCFMAKVDVSEVKMEDPQEVLPMPESLLKTRGKKCTR